MATYAHIERYRTSGLRRRWTFQTILWVFGLFQVARCLTAENEKPAVEEFEAKAVLVYHFAKLTSWPEGTFKNEHAPIEISVYGDKGFYEALRKYHGKRINNRTLSIRHTETIGQDPPPQILYITGELNAVVAFYLKEHSSPTLTVGESKAFAEKGGILSIVRVDDHLTLYSNLKSAVKTKLYLNNNLVKLTKQVTPSDPDSDQRR